MQELLASNIAQNLQLVVQIAKEYTEQLGADKIIALLEGVNSYNGLYYYLGAYLAFSEDPEVGHCAARLLGRFRCQVPMVCPMQCPKQHLIARPARWRRCTTSTSRQPPRRSR